MRKSFFVFSASILVLLLVGLVPMPGYAQNLVTNGGFETGDYTGWTQTPAASGSVLQVFPVGFAHSGNYVAAMGANGGLQDTISQNLNTLPGGRYLVSFYLAPDGSPNSFTAKFNNATLLNFVDAPATGTYTHYTYLVTATSSSAPLSFGAYNTPYYDFLDDVSVTLEQAPRAVAPQFISLVGQNMNDFQNVMQMRANGMATDTVMTTADTREVQVADASGGVGLSNFSKPANYVAWMQGIGSFQSMGSGADAVRANSGGLAFGLEAPFPHDVRAGISFEYVRSAVSVSNAGAGTVDTYGVGLYGSHKMNGFVTDASLSAAYDATTNSTNGVMVKSGGYGLGAGTGIRYPLQLDIGTLEPRLGFDYAYSHQNSSTYADPFTTIVTAASGENFLRSTLGARLSRIYVLDDGSKFTPDIEASWAHQILNPAASVQENVPAAGSSFTITGVNPGRDAGILGVGASYGLLSYGKMAKFDVYGHYDATVSGNATEHLVIGGLRFSF